MELLRGGSRDIRLGVYRWVSLGLREEDCGGTLGSRVVVVWTDGHLLGPLNWMGHLQLCAGSHWAPLAEWEKEDGRAHVNCCLIIGKQYHKMR